MKQFACCWVGLCLIFVLAGGVARTADTQRDASTTEHVVDRLAVAGLKEAEVREFLARVKTAAKDRDAQALAKMARYPIEVSISGTSVTIESAEQFVGRYEEFMDSKMTDLIAATTFNHLWANYQGVMIGNGALSFGGLCRDDECEEYDIRILTIDGV